MFTPAPPQLPPPPPPPKKKRKNNKKKKDFFFNIWIICQFVKNSLTLNQVGN